MKGLTSISVLLVLTTCECYSRSSMYLPGMKVRSPAVFRPGPSLMRPWMGGSQRHLHSASNRNPYFMYKGSTRYHKPLSMSAAGGPWRTTVPLTVTAAPLTSTMYDYFRASPSIPPISIHGDRGPLRTIPAPDLSLSDKPIVVADTKNELKLTDGSSKLRNPTYEVTEKSLEFTNNTSFQPQGFTHNLALTKSPNVASPDLLQLLRNSGPPFQIADPYSFPLLQQPQLFRQTAFGPQLTLQAFNAIMQPSVSTDANMLQQSILFKPDPSYVHKLQNQFYPRYPYDIFQPFPAESFAQTSLFLPDPTSHTVINNPEENPLQNVSPTQQIVVADSKEEPIEKTTEQSNNTTEVNEVNPTVATYTQVPESAVNVIPNGVTAAPNLKEATELQQEINANATIIQDGEALPLSTELKPYFISSNITNTNSSDALTPIHGSPFSKDGTLNTTYSFHKTEQNNINKDGAVLAGHIVEGSVLEDEEFEQEKEKKTQDRAPIRLRMPPELVTTTERPVRHSYKTRKSNHKKHSSSNRVEFDEKTGEPVIRIYASSYKRGEKPLATTPKHVGRGVTKMRIKASDEYEWKGDPHLKAFDQESHDYDREQISMFGQRLRSRKDSFLPLFED